MQHDPLYQNRIDLLGSQLLFTQTFFQLRTNRKFIIDKPDGREAAAISICRALMRLELHHITRLYIGVPPRYGKTEQVIHFIARSFARYPDSNFMYISFSHSLARKQTGTVKQILELPDYKNLFEPRIRSDVRSKDDFETVQGGSCYAAGAQGTITGRGAGIQFEELPKEARCGLEDYNRFGGCMVIDDIIKPDEALSDTIREGSNEWYQNTLKSRLNSPYTPILIIGQRTHETDLPGWLMSGKIQNIGKA